MTEFIEEILSEKNSLVPRKTIEEIVEQRDEAVAEFTQVAEDLTNLYKRSSGISHLLRDACGGSINTNYITNRRDHDEQYNRMFDDYRGWKPEKALEMARMHVDASVWMHLIKFTKLDTIMDKQAKDDLIQSLNEDVPEVTVDNVYATMETMCMDARMIYMRGIANVFSKLDRRFRSHDAWKIGSRIIITNAFGSWGHWNYHANHEATLIDVERVFSQLDKGVQTNTLVGVINEQRKKDSANRSHFCDGYRSLIDTDYFRIRVFKNGNCHIWFKRDDLVTRVNKLIAEYYGEVLPDGREHNGEKDPFEDVKMTPAKNFGFFPTPPEVVDRLLDRVYIQGGDNVLEPSAGTGNIAYKLAQMGGKVDCVEIQRDMANQLEQSGRYDNVYCMDFHHFKTDKRYDAIVMNPPFDRGRDIDHVVAAYKLLAEGGLLVSVMSAGVEFSTTKKAVAFRKMVKDQGGYFYDLPQNSFSSVGTNVNTVIVSIPNKKRY